MKLPIFTLLGILVLGSAASARADVGWSEEQYVQLYGKGQRGFGKVNERAFNVGDNGLVVEFSGDNTHSVGEMWVLGVVRDIIPDQVRKAGETAEKGKEVEHVAFQSKSAIPAEIREAVVDDQVVRVDVRNHLVTRIAFCGPQPRCGLWQRIFGPPCQTEPNCAILERALGVDRTMDDLHKRAEAAVEKMVTH